MISRMMSNMIRYAVLFLLLCQAYFSVDRKLARRKGRGSVNTERSTRIMFNNYLYEKTVRDRHKEGQREMEQCICWRVSSIPGTDGDDTSPNELESF
jgi:hypothetical protein